MAIMVCTIDILVGPLAHNHRFVSMCVCVHVKNTLADKMVLIVLWWNRMIGFSGYVFVSSPIFLLNFYILWISDCMFRQPMSDNGPSHSCIASMYLYIIYFSRSLIRAVYCYVHDQSFCSIHAQFSTDAEKRL